MIPEGMTAEKLRYIAEWMVIYDRMSERYLEILEQAGVDVPSMAVAAVRSKEIQDDLLLWADQIDGV